MAAVLTTIDNPYDPIKQYDDWRAYDVQEGYYTNELLARISTTSSDLSDEDEELFIEEAIDRIINLFPSLYKKLYLDEKTGEGGT